MDVRQLEIGDRVHIETVYAQYYVYQYNQAKYIGEIGKIICVHNRYGSCDIQFDSGDMMTYPQCCLRKVDDVVLHISEKNIKPNYKLFVGRPLHRINYLMCISHISVCSNLDTSVANGILNGTYSGRETIIRLVGKTVTVLPDNYIATVNVNGVMHTFVGVKYGDKKYFLPIHSLYDDNIPVYKPRKISRV